MLSKKQLLLALLSIALLLALWIFLLGSGAGFAPRVGLAVHRTSSPTIGVNPRPVLKTSNETREHTFMYAHDVMHAPKAPLINGTREMSDINYSGNHGYTVNHSSHVNSSILLAQKEPLVPKLQNKDDDTNPQDDDPPTTGRRTHVFHHFCENCRIQELPEVALDQIFFFL